MARRATLIDTTRDLFGDRWDVREYRPTEHGFAVPLGWPSGAQRGRGGVGGPRVIVTTAIAGHFETHRLTPSKLCLPIGGGAIKRVRRLLSHHRQVDAAKWWEDRAADLADMTIARFCARHNVSTGAAATARILLFGKTLRPAGWWRQPEAAAILLSDQPRAAIADQMGLSVGSVGRLRWMLRRD